MGVSVTKQISPVPGAAAGALGFISSPAWCRLIFWLPNLSARRPPSNMATSSPSTLR